MKAAIEFAPWRDQLAEPRRSTDGWYRMAGLAVAVGFPTLFWVTALGLLTKSTAMSVAGLASIGLVIAAIAFVGAVVVTAEARLK